MYTVNAPSIGVAHREAVGKIITYGVSGITEDKELVVYLEDPLCIHVSNPLHDYNKDVNSSYGAKFDEQYVHKTTHITPRKNDGMDAVYTYGNRIRDYLQPYGLFGSDNMFSLVGDGDLEGLSAPAGYDQLEACWKKLQENPNTRRASMSTWIPWKDHESHDPPCIMVISLERYREYLSLVAFIRSNDILMAWGQNAIALTAILELSALQLGCKVSYLETISRNAHVYYKRDQNYLNDMGFKYDK